MAAAAALPPVPVLKSFALTHILYDPSHPPYLSLPLTLLSLSPIFLFVAYFTLVIFTRRFTIFKLALGQVANEALSLILKKLLKGKRPYADMGMGEVGEGYGMPSSHSQAAGFLVAWGVGFALTLNERRRLTGGKEQVKVDSGVEIVRKVRVGVYVFGLVLWSLLTAYSRHYLLYHSVTQVVAGYTVGLLFGSFEFVLGEYIPMHHPESWLGKWRRLQVWLWEGIGGVGGWDLGSAAGGWGEGHLLVGTGFTTKKTT